MKDINTVLAVIDPTAGEHPVLSRAGWLAEKTGASIDLFICDYDRYLAGERFFDSASLGKARAGLMQRNLERLGKLAQPLLDRGLAVTVDAVWDRPLHEGIVRKVERSRPDLVLKDTHYHQPLRRSIFSNTDWSLIRDCPAPLMLVKPSSRSGLSRVLAAVDPVHERDKPSDLDHEIIGSAIRLCTAVGAELHVVHAFDPAPAYAVSADAMSFPIAEPVNELMLTLKRRHRAALDDLVARYSLPPANVHLAEGDARDVLVNKIEALDADLLVMGAVARGAVQRLLLGSTAERVLDFVPCDLLIVKASEDRG